MIQETETMEVATGRGRATRLVNQIIDIREFKSYAVYPWLVMAANPHLSAPDIMEHLAEQDESTVFRPARWISKRRWMCGPRRKGGNRSNADGLDPQAFKLLAENRELSLRDMVRLLKEHKIPRGREWVRTNRAK